MKEIVGQKQLLETLDKHISSGNFPQFSILSGLRGSGKRLVANYIAKKLFPDREPYIVEPAIDKVREMIEYANSPQGANTAYILADADSLSNNAKNALLKTLEEPPTNTYFIMTVEDEAVVLRTLKSRAVLYQMQPYRAEELLNIARHYRDDDEFYTISTEHKAFVLNTCETPYEIDLLHKCGIQELYDFVDNVMCNLATVSKSNALKLGNKISYSADDTENFDLRLFWKAFLSRAMDKLDTDVTKYIPAITITSKYISQLHTRSINKKSTFDAWVLEMREAWSNENDYT